MRLVDETNSVLVPPLLMVKTLLVAFFNPLATATSVSLVTATVKLKLVNVTLPLESVVAFVMPFNPPLLPGDSVMAVPLCDTLVPDLSVICTTTFASFAPTAVFTGPVENNNW
jgi:hypothetical protein